jgi:hypothetical protein
LIGKKLFEKLESKIDMKIYGRIDGRFGKYVGKLKGLIQPDESSQYFLETFINAPNFSGRKSVTWTVGLKEISVYKTRKMENVKGGNPRILDSMKFCITA